MLPAVAVKNIIKYIIKWWLLKNLPFIATLTCMNSTFLCQNGGTCFNNGQNGRFGFSCNCPTGFSGELCELSKI